MVLNKQAKVTIDGHAVRAFVRKLRRSLKLGRRDFNVCFVDDAQMTQLNGRYRKQARPTDVLSFRWDGVGEGCALPRAARGRPSHLVAPVVGWRNARIQSSRLPHPVGAGIDPHHSGEFAGFLGDVVISAQTARRNASAAGHSAAREVRWLILHGVLHLLGYDHDTDQGEMRQLELALRAQLGA